MSTTFDFSISGVQAQSTAAKRLKPWDIYSVKFMGCRVDHVQGKKDPNAVYDILKVRFEGKDGYFEESIFFPKETDAQRPKYTNKEGHEYEAPSSWERTKTFIAQLASVINPEGWVKMQELSQKGAFKSFGDMCAALIKITDPKKGEVTNLKLIGKTDKDGNVVAALPKFVALSKEGKLFTSDNFVGDKLFFSTYEEGKRKEYLNTKPTKTPSTPEPNLEAPAQEEESDLDSLLGTL